LLYRHRRKNGKKEGTRMPSAIIGSHRKGQKKQR
jgi:hypothetical protein